MALVASLQEDAMQAMKALISWHQQKQMRYIGKEAVELSLILSDDRHIQALNETYLNVDAPTDVLSFPMDGAEEDMLPVMLLGDIVLSLDTAQRQAERMGHTLLTECRILLVHGLLHLLGYDHDRSEEEWAQMAALEKETLASLGWKGTGLISNAKRIMLEQEIDPRDVPSHRASDEDKAIRNGFNFQPVQEKILPEKSPTVTVATEKDKVQLVALDLDGTLLTSDQRITHSTKEVIEEAIRQGIHVVIATGKARPGAIAACQKFGLYGEGSLVSHQSAGIFLQGLIVHSVTGEPLIGPSIAPDVVRSAFNYATTNDVSCVAFTGDECVTLKRTPALVELHQRYYEPLAKELSSIDQIVEGTPVKKIIFLSDPKSIKDEIRPYWDSHLSRSSSKSTIAVSNMLELIPRGVNKWVGLSSLLQSMNLRYESCMTVGDGLNDYEMIKHAALGVAMGNAVDEVKSVADYVVASNDEDGVAEAFARFILS